MGEVRVRSARGGRGVAGAETAEDDVADRPVHGLGHLQRQDGSGRADQGTGDDHGLVVDREAGHGDRETGQGVEQRHDDRCVGAADRQHHEHSEGQRREQHDQQQHDVVRVQEGEDTSAEGHGDHGDIGRP
nr:hypothetical protein [Streptomyces sp. NRRL WC-3618]